MGALVCATVASAQPIFKCISPAGQVSFQQQACAGKGEQLVVPSINVVESAPAGDAGLRAQAARGEAVRVAVARGMVLSGMSASEMQQVMGAPTVVNTDYFGGSVRRQHVYRAADGTTRYVYTRDGYVTGVQHRPSVSQPKAFACSSEGGLADLRFRLGSVTRTPEEKHQIRQQLREAERNRCN